MDQNGTPSPLKIAAVIDHATSRVSSARYAWILVVVFAVAGTGRILYSGGNLVVAGAIGFLGLFLAVLFHRAANAPAARFGPQVQVIVWFVTLFFCVAVSVAFSSVAFDAPHVFRRFLLPNEPQSATSEVSPLAPTPAPAAPATISVDNSNHPVDNSTHVTNARGASTTNNTTNVTFQKPKYGSWDIPAEDIDSEEILNRELRILLGKEADSEIPAGSGFAPSYSKFMLNFFGDDNEPDLRQRFMLDNYKKVHDGQEVAAGSPEWNDMLWRSQKMTGNLDALAAVALDSSNPHDREAAGLVRGQAARAILAACASGEIFGSCQYADDALDRSLHISKFDIQKDASSFFQKYDFSLECFEEFLKSDPERKVKFSVPLNDELAYGYLVEAYPDSDLARRARSTDQQRDLTKWYEFRAAKDAFMSNLASRLGVNRAGRLQFKSFPDIDLPNNLEDKAEQAGWPDKALRSAYGNRNSSFFTSMNPIDPRRCREERVRHKR